MRYLTSTLTFVVVFGLAAITLWITAEAFAASQQRTSEYRYLSDALEATERPDVAVSWIPPERALVRQFTLGDEALVGAAMTQAWRAYSAASDTGETTLLADHFAGIAFARAKLAAQQAWLDETRMVVLETEAQPQFLHFDGSVVQVSATATTVRYALEQGVISNFELTRDKVLTTLTNETTGWRIFSHERTGSEALTRPARPVFSLPRLTGVNYYPAKTPWLRFWPEIDADIIAADLDLVADLEGNTVRIFLPVAAFGPDLDGERNLRNLNTFLSLAKDRDIFVIPTLFDLKPGYRPALWADDVAYLRRVLPVLAASSAVAILDLKNQPDLDRKVHGAGLVEAWLTTMAMMSNEIAPNLAVTIGWSSAEAAPGLAALVDAVSYHDYAEVEGTADRLAVVRTQSGGKPVLVTEVGTSSFDLALGFPGSEAAQAAVLQDRLDQLATADGVLVWTLHDFAAPDAAAVGGSPWVQRLQAHFGLYDASGAAKLAAQVVAKAFAAAPDAN